jgi:pimeloyl-ACP methyl ester carboxylesterase
MGPTDLPRSGFLSSQRRRLHYVEWGDPEGMPLILLHGGRDHCRSWDRIAGELQEDGWRIIAPDLCGHGDSDWSAEGLYTMTSFIYDLAELIQQLDLQQVRLVAHSLGGNIGLHYAGVFPERVAKIVSIEGLGYSPAVLADRQKAKMAQQMRDWIEARRGLDGRPARRYATVDEARERMQSENKHLSPDLADHLTRHGLRRNEDGSFGWKFDPYLRSFEPTEFGLARPQDLWSRIPSPVLLIYGADSWASNPLLDGRAAHFQEARVVVIEEANHWVHHDQPARVMTELKAFL